MKKRIVIVDDHTSVRDMLACILANDSNYEIVGHASTGLAGMKVCASLRPDVAVLDLLLPELCGVELTRRLLADQPGIRVLVYSGTVNPVLIIDALKCRPHGFVAKSDTLQTFRDALAAVCAGRSYFTPFATTLLYESMASPHGAPIHLSGREREILQLVAEGRSSKEIANVLGSAVKTVENQRAHLMEKLHMHDIASLTRYAVKLGVVSLD